MGNGRNIPAGIINTNVPTLGIIGNILAGSHIYVADLAGHIIVDTDIGIDRGKYIVIIAYLVPLCAAAAYSSADVFDSRDGIGRCAGHNGLFLVIASGLLYIANIICRTQPEAVVRQISDIVIFHFEVENARFHFHAAVRTGIQREFIAQISTGGFSAFSFFRRNHHIFTLGLVHPYFGSRLCNTSSYRIGKTADGAFSL